MDAETAYFLKKYYPRVIKWWLVEYNPEFFRVWPSKAEEEEALRLEAQEAELLALEQTQDDEPDIYSEADESAFNAATGSYSGLYGQKPVDEDTQAALDAIMMSNSSSQSDVDFLLSGGKPKTSAAYSIADAPGNDDVPVPPEQDEIIREANEIYARLLREAAEDEAKKRAEIEKARQDYEQENAST